MSTDSIQPVSEILPSGKMIEIRLTDAMQQFITLERVAQAPTNVLRAHSRSGGAGPSDETGARTHFLALLREMDDDAALADPRIQTIFPRRQALEVCDEYDVGRSLAAVARDVARGRLDYAQAIKDGFLRRLWQYTRGFDIEKDSFPLQFGVPIPIAELHRPQVEGTKASIRRVATRDDSLELSLNIGALGGGFGARHKVTITSGVEAPGDCQLISAEVSGSATIWRHLDTDERIFLLSLTGISGTWSAQPIAADDPRHACARTTDLAPIMSLLKYKHAVVDRDYGYIRPAPAQAAPPVLESKVAMSTEREYKGVWRVGLSDELPDIGGISISSKFTHEVEWALQYAAGPEMLGTFPSDEEWPLRWSHA